jgi:hypothetical protein
MNNTCTIPMKHVLDFHSKAMYFFGYANWVLKIGCHLPWLKKNGLEIMNSFKHSLYIFI